MAVHTAGAGATVTGVSQSAPTGPASKERYVYGLLAKLEQEENNLTKVASRTDSISISVNLSTKLATVSLVLNCQATNTSAGQVTQTATHYLTGSTFTSGTGGSSAAPNLTQAVMQGVVDLKLLELDTAKNPSNASNVRRCQFVLAASGGTNATFSADIDFPVEVLQLPGGGSVIEGKDWLL
ncbi:MAG: hypothetical protein JGK17_32340 [Microcoleus sp. PH2017_10_PVI_O_A]|uniref:hypothetical protein n=1 Tax=unclassified Microcoleus TaxID=2642155 RepID=UPI001DC7006F|nr:MULTISPECIES: hypothetical protein [unclassified Microcoleus]TAE86774.1 MAG: hypothetical protein EAZ83_00125 [Oscillatoriales cyanobacterium]MCC3410139.1 hypothetical protein [Microcoleus sp. PH2017_10_PVI_O_A]MCC3464410.1 hypothetical protein [Microcoleus sp. PH2017_11_PCY_U_A]MCC3482741.1 hypothetical protein [Microcoleus sp. PH2017_12_PCY_D_A]MCC3532571.1 hypothetical protein [Microcoleus sp. PH2017_21_RUC_O_A]